ncbi:MAG: hypothetical protein Q8920_10320 [Bacillota bacterium]|nr:hypothetical protein [Bacillota bacterium]
MVEKIAYCENCNADVEYNVRTEIIDCDMDGIKFAYEAVIANCKNCGSEVYVDEINDINIIRAYSSQKRRLDDQAEKEENEEQSIFKEE